MTTVKDTAVVQSTTRRETSPPSDEQRVNQFSDDVELLVPHFLKKAQKLTRVELGSQRSIGVGKQLSELLKHEKDVFIGLVKSNSSNISLLLSQREQVERLENYENNVIKYFCSEFSYFEQIARYLEKKSNSADWNDPVTQLVRRLNDYVATYGQKDFSTFAHALIQSTLNERLKELATPQELVLALPEAIAAQPKFPSIAPELWSEATSIASHYPPLFIEQVYKPWLSRGLTMADIRRLDAPLAEAFYDHLRAGGRVPSDFSVPLDEAPFLWPGGKSTTETPPEFVMRVYGPWMGKGLTLSDIRKLDQPLAQALYYHKRMGKPIPATFDLPSKPEVVTREVESLNLGDKANEVLGNFTAREAARIRSAVTRRKDK